MKLLFKTAGILVLLLSCSLLSKAQQDALFSTTGIKLIGQVNMKENGQLFLAQSKTKGFVNVFKLNKDLEKVWDVELENPAAYEKEVHDVVVRWDNENIYWISGATDLHLTTLDQATGEITEAQNKIKHKTTAKESIRDVFINTKGDICAIRNVKGRLDFAQLSENQPTLKFKPAYHSLGENESADMTTAYVKNDYVYAYRYSMNHSFNKMKLNLILLNTEGQILNEKVVDFNLDHHAFTQNSSVDPNLMYFHPSDDGFFIFGKLDYHFKKGYVSNKAGDGFVGFWWAKVNQNMEVEFFREYSLNHFEGLITNGVINKPSVIDFKEDNQGGVFMNINILPSMIYQQEYVIYLDSMGIYKTMIGGMDDYNFFEYRQNGVRATAKKTNLRLVNDDWRFYATKFLHLIRYEPEHHSNSLRIVQLLSHRNGHITTDHKIYNISEVNNNFDVVFEYTAKKGGTLSAYKVPRH